MDDDEKAIQRLEDELAHMRRRFAQMDETQKNLQLRDDALQKSEELYTRLVDTIPDFIIRTDVNGNILFANDYTLEITAYSREELEGQNILRFVTPEDHERVIIDTHDMLENRLGPREYRLIMKNGSKIPFEINGDVLRNQDGTPFGMVYVCRNITDRIQVQEDLRIREERYRGIANHLPGGVFQFFARHNGEMGINYISDNAREMLGLSNDHQRLFTELSACIAPEERERFFESIRDAVQTVGKWDYEGKYIKPAGEEMYLRGISVPVPVDDGLIFNGVILDVTERVQAVKALEESEERFRSLIQNSLDIIFIVDEKGSITYESPSVKQVLQYPAGELIGKNPINFVHPDDIPAVREKMSEVIGHIHTGIPVECRFKRADGEWVHVESVGNNLIGYPGINGIVITGRDITERKKARETELEMEHRLLQAQKVESMGRLAGGVAHDFNNMLSVIIGNTEMALSKTDPSDPFHKRLTEILNAGRRSADLTRQLLAFARKQEVSPKVLNLNEMVSSMIKMLRRLIGENIDLGWHPGCDLWKVKIDPSQVDQILANLMVNARDAIEKTGSITIETSNETCDEAYSKLYHYAVPGDYVVLAVSDNGCGIDPKTLDNIFEPFFTTKKDGQGTGLGLATVYGIVKQNNGFINVYSEPGRGTTFRIYLQRYMDESLAEDDEEEADIQGGTETILIVEDEPTVLRLSKSMLEMLGYTVWAASGKDQALQLANEHGKKIDLLLTDVVMPGMNGKELSERILALIPGIKCLYMSGYTADVIARQGILDQGVKLISKPFSIQDLAAKIREALE